MTSPLAMPLASGPALPSERRAVPLVAVIDVIDRDGQIRQTHPVPSWPVSVGRSLDNDLVLTDPYVAPRHLAIEVDGADGLVIAVGETRNGVLLGSQRLRQGERRRLADDDHQSGRHRTASGAAKAARMAPPFLNQSTEMTLGRTRLRLHLPGQSIAPELPLASVVPLTRRLAPSAIGALVLLAMQFFSTWLGNDPDGFGRAVGSTLTTTLGGALVWCGAWSLLSKTFTRQARFGWHLQVFLFGAIALLLVGVVPAALAFAFSFPAVADFAFIGSFVVGAVAVYFHLLAVEPSRPRLLRWVVASGALAGIALTLWLNLSRADLYGEELYMSHLFPPAMRLVRTVPPDRFLDGLAALKPVLDRKAKQADTSDSGLVTNGDSDE